MTPKTDGKYIVSDRITVLYVCLPFKLVHVPMRVQRNQFVDILTFVYSVRANVVFATYTSEWRDVYL